MTLMALLAQTDPRIGQALERIANAQIAITVFMALTALFTGLLIALFLVQYRSIMRIVKRIANTADTLQPHVIPLIDRAKSVTDDVAGLTDNVRRKVDDVLHTLEELRRAVARGGEATEERVRRFAAVLDVVQTEAEEILLDATATARGVHETARALQKPRPALRRPRRSHEEDEE